MSATTDVTELQAALMDMVRQFAGWSELNGGCFYTDGMSSLERAFEALGYGDLMPAPNDRCDEPGCMKQATYQRPSPTGYRHTCYTHTQHDTVLRFSPQSSREVILVNPDTLAALWKIAEELADTCTYRGADVPDIVSLALDLVGRRKKEAEQCPTTKSS